MKNIISGSSYSLGAITTMLGALSLNDWALVVGIGCTLGTFGVNWYYKRKEFKIKFEVENGDKTPN